MVYGWNVDNSDRIRLRTANGNPILDNLILFSPDVNSHWCTDHPKLGEPFHKCVPVDWAVEVEKGFYHVEITLGDSEIMARYDL